MASFFKNILKRIGDSIFINYKCMCCGRETGNESLICDKCLSKITLINKSICNKCGSLLENMEAVCINCYDKKYKFDTHRSCIIYDYLSSRPVKLLKYQKRKYLAEPIAKIMYAMHKDVVDNSDIIVFVPMTKTKTEKREYNHTQEIAKHLSKMSNVKLVDALVKKFDTAEQVSLNFKERTKNLKGSFDINSNNAGIIKGKNVLLVDDVFTTGSTSNECAKMLLKAKAHSVNVLTFLKTDPSAKEEELLTWILDNGENH